jgi:hypothetical protein
MDNEELLDYYSLGMVRDEILESYEIGAIERWEKDLLLSNLYYTMVRINELAEGK